MPTHEPNHEVRFAVVIYGGVSLAIYINGIVQEMLRMVRATSALVDSPKGTERIYRRLGQILGDAGRSPSQMNDEIGDGEAAPVRVRFNIDVLSGTSAGGINAMFLAKALVNNQSLDQIETLWIEEGNIETLINDPASLTKRLSLQKPPQSLLNSDRMYLKLLEALDAMDSQGASPGLVEALDLFSTTTDITGLEVPIALADGMVMERRHRNVFHFKVPCGDNDFSSEANPFLAFAARCTSAFPFAFEPMTLNDVFPILRTAPKHLEQAYCKPSLNAWKRFYSEYIDGKRPERIQPPFEERAFGDGGYLDNKPFSYAIDAVLTRHAELPVTRKLVYIEPNPEKSRRPKVGRPDALDNSLSALVALPRYETIREDLERVVAHNREVERVRRVMADIDLGQARGGDQPEQWLSEDHDSEGLGYKSYERLKLSAILDDLVVLLAKAFGVDPGSGMRDALRSLLQVWRADVFPDRKSQRRFLLDFDVSYRLRRIRYLRNQINRECRGKGNAAELAELRSIKAKLKAPHDRLLALLFGCRAQDAALTSNAILPTELSLIQEPPVGISWPDNYPHAQEMSVRGRESRARYLLAQPSVAARVKTVAAALRLEFEQVCKETSSAVRRAIEDDANLTAAARASRALVRGWFEHFEAYDASVFPITFGTDVGEAEPIGIHRISPDDTPALAAAVAVRGDKIKGQALGAFGAFLDESWRRNDILWGRLDGAERLISILLPGRDAETSKLRQKLIEEAQQAIVVEALELTGSKTTEWQKHLREFVANDVAPSPEPKLIVRSAARATAVTGSLLEHLADQRRVTGRPFATLASVGRLLWQFVEVSMPHSPLELFGTYWLQLLFLCATLVLLVGVFGDGSLLSFGALALTVLVIVYFARAALRRYFARQTLVSNSVVVLSIVAVTGGLTALSWFFLDDAVEGWNALTSALQARMAGPDRAYARVFNHVAGASLLVLSLVGAGKLEARRVFKRVAASSAPRPMIALRLASASATIDRVLGGGGDRARRQLLRFLAVDYAWIGACGMFFVASGAAVVLRGYSAGWLLIALSLFGCGANVMGNLALASLGSSSRSDPPRHLRPCTLTAWSSSLFAALLTVYLYVSGRVVYAGPATQSGLAAATEAAHETRSTEALKSSRTAE